MAVVKISGESTGGANWMERIVNAVSEDPKGSVEVIIGKGTNQDYNVKVVRKKVAKLIQLILDCGGSTVGNISVRAE